jgi:hypothetical protein
LRTFKKPLRNYLPVNWHGFREWFEVFDAESFDAAIWRDAESGKLDAVAKEAIAAYRARKVPRAGST